jgi:integrase
MTAEQVRAMAEAMPAHYRAFVILLAGTGKRPAEGLGQCRGRVRWLERSIRVDQQLLTLAGDVPKLAPPKTPASVRTIAVPDEVLAVLAHHVERYTPEGSELLFVDDKGDPIRRNALGHAWRRAMVTAKVEGFTPHDLRHYAASVMIHRGASVKAVQRHLGHKTATVTLNTYAHLWPEDADVTRSSLAAGLVGVVDEVASLCVMDVSEHPSGATLHAI